MLKIRIKMTLPMLNRCCGCVPLKLGCVILVFMSLLLCVCDIAAGARNLPSHQEREPEDNLISMSMVMFSTLSAISNIFILVGILLRRPGYLQFAMLFNSLFIMFIFLVAVVTCLFSIELKPYLQDVGTVAMILVGLLAGAAYCLYYLLVVNSLYRLMKSNYSDSAIPV